MTRMSRTTPRLQEEQALALTDYLDALLRELPCDYTDTVGPEPLPISAPDASEPPLAELALSTSAVEAESEPKRRLPAWAAAPMQILLFRVTGMTLAVPLFKLNGILEWSDQLTAMPGHAPWFVGIQTERGRHIKVIDTALLVVPGRYRQHHSVDDLGQVVLIGDGEWGLACQQVDEVVQVTPDQVRWRGQHSKRPWLAGTVVDRMCALLDVDEFVSLLGSDQVGIEA